MANREGKNGKIHAPRNRTANKAYNEHYGKLLAAERVMEMKAAKFGRLTALDRYADLFRLRKEGYTNVNRKETYTKAMHLYDQNEFVRPAINIIVGGMFPRNSPDFVGDNETLIEFTDKIVENNSLNFHELGREGELAGDVFLWFRVDGDKSEVRSLDPRTIDLVLADEDIRRPQGYKMKGRERLISMDRVEHLKINSTTTSQYGRSSVRHVIYWIDVIDTLFEQNWLRGAQYYGNPLLCITGVPAPYQANVKSQIEAQTQRAGRSWVLPPDSEVVVPDFTLGFPIDAIVSWCFRLISIATEIPITLFGTADAASRGTAFFATPRFELSINPRREVWRIGLRNFFLKVARANGIIGADQYISRREFDVTFTPMFEKDLAELADTIEAYRDRGIISLQSARQMLGLDHSKEEDRIEDEGGIDSLVAPADRVFNRQMAGRGPDGAPRSAPKASNREGRRAKRAKRAVKLED